MTGPGTDPAGGAATVGGAWLERAAPVLAALDGHAAWVVGGAVRNALLGEPVADVDIATDAPPEEVIDRAARAGLRTVPTGLAHGTVTVIADGRGYEVTTFRRDEATDGRHARVAFGADLVEDAARRDFTMNALYATAAGAVTDPLGAGLPDLFARRVRFVGRAEERIREDYLRILRFFRFHAWYGRGAPEAEAMAACAALAPGLARLSRERVGAEVMKLLAAPDPAPAVAQMGRAGVLDEVLGGADPAVLSRVIALERAQPGGGIAPDPLRRLVALGGEGDLRLSRDAARRLAALNTAAHARTGPAELGYRLGAQAALDAGLVRAARRGGALPEGWAEAAARGAGARFPLRAADLPDLGGAALGARLRALEARWIAGDFRATREELLAPQD